MNGATDSNNPVEYVFEEAKSIWLNAKSHIQCIASIGIGVPDLKGLGDNVKEVISTLKAISTEAEVSDTKKISKTVNNLASQNSISDSTTGRRLLIPSSGCMAKVFEVFTWPWSSAGSTFLWRDLERSVYGKLRSYCGEKR